MSLSKTLYPLLLVDQPRKTGNHPNVAENLLTGTYMYGISEFIWDFGKLPFPSHLGKYFNEIGKISAKIHEIGKIKAIFGFGMT